MSETTSSLIKIISAITSARTAFKLLIIAFSLFVCWINLPSYLALYDIPSEISFAIITLIGCGGGALTSSFLSFLFGKYENCKAESDKKKQTENKNTEYKKEFEEVFNHYSYDKRAVLRQLTVRDTVYNLSANQSGIGKDPKIEILELAGYIKRKGKVDSGSTLYTINPLIREYVSMQWKEEITSNMDEFFSTTTEFKDFILKSLESEPSDPNHHFAIENEIFENEKRSIECCFNIYDESPSNSDYYIEFKPGYSKVFSQKLSKEFLDEVQIFVV